MCARHPYRGTVCARASACQGQVSQELATDDIFLKVLSMQRGAATARGDAPSRGTVLIAEDSPTSRGAETSRGALLPRAAVLGSTLSSSERVAARKALSRLDIQCAERRTQEDVSPDERVFIVVGNDLAAAESLAKRCRLQCRPAHRPLRTETDCSRRVAVAGGQALWGSTCSTPSLHSGTCCGSRYALSRQSGGFRSTQVLYEYRAKCQCSGS